MLRVLDIFQPIGDPVGQQAHLARQGRACFIQPVERVPAADHVPELIHAEAILRTFTAAGQGKTDHPLQMRNVTGFTQVNLQGHLPG